MNKQILLCDPDSRAVALVERVFPQFHCDIVASAAAAIAKLDCEPPDIFVMGTELPDLNYMELLGKIRQSQKLQDLAIIVLADEDPAVLNERLMPYKVTSVLRKPTESETAAAELKQSTQEAPSKPVLIIAKSSSERKILSNFLTNHGFRAYAYSDVRIALQALDEMCPRVLVFDLEDSLSFVDQIFDRLMKDPKHRPGLVIAVSGSGNDALRASLLSRGVDLFLKKPLTAGILSSALGKSKSSSAATAEAPTEGSDNVSQDDMEASRRRNVLIVTPSVVCGRSVSVALSGTNFHISTASSGDIAKNILHGHEVDLIILDLSVSEDYTSKFISELRRGGNGTPTLALTQAVSSQERVFLERQGVNRVLEKPYTNETLVQVVSELLFPELINNAVQDVAPSPEDTYV